ncbi:MAG: glucokinase [Kofleriaceae bacterium]
MILAGDIGGTKTTLALCDDRGTVVREATVPSGDWASLENIVDHFAPGPVTAACFGVAGPVVDGVAKITNLPWTIASRSLAQALGGAKIALLNDLQATALGMLVIPEASFAVLQPGPRPDQATIAVIAPGTGLGEATLYHDGRGYRALPSEGGHADFAPGTDDEILLLRYLRGLYGEHVSYERVLSGHGIGDLYGFCRERATEPEPAWLARELATGDRNAVVSQAGLDRKEPCAVRALAMFAEILGAEAGNLALRSVATGGILIGGGIPPKILPALQTGAFAQRLTAKGRFSTWTRALSVRVALEPRAALLGAAHEATLL